MVLYLLRGGKYRCILYKQYITNNIILFVITILYLTICIVLFCIILYHDLIMCVCYFVSHESNYYIVITTITTKLNNNRFKFEKYIHSNEFKFFSSIYFCILHFQIDVENTNSIDMRCHELKFLQRVHLFVACIHSFYY